MHRNSFARVGALGIVFSVTMTALAGEFPLLGATSLFDVLPFETWKHAGGAAKFALEATASGQGAPTLIGRGPIERNGFLVSPRVLGDFHLSLDVKLGSTANPKGEKMNSGIQIRSQEKNGTIAGLQIEIDPSPRAWSGGVYDEGGRAWLAPLRDNEAARAAFKLGEWNHYEIDCNGPRIATSINGVACAQWFDATVSGVLAFQVHGGGECEVAFRAPMLEEQGTHAWSAFEDEAAASSGERCAWSHTIAESVRGVRMNVTESGHVVVLAADGARLLDVAFAPRPVVLNAEGSGLDKQRAATPAEAAQPRMLDILWLDGEGAVLLDGALVQKFKWTQTPTHMRVLGEKCEVANPQSLAKSRPPTTSELDESKKAQPAAKVD